VTNDQDPFLPDVFDDDFGANPVSVTATPNTHNDDNVLLRDEVMRTGKTIDEDPEIIDTVKIIDVFDEY
jgi:hypothetical protein